MDDGRYKRLVRLLVASWVAIAILLVLITSLGTYQLSQVRSLAIENGTRTVTGPQGTPGEDGAAIIGPRGERGEPGKDGKDGRDGRDGVDGHDGRDGVDGVDGEPGPQGVPGETGAPGKTVMVREYRGKLECKYQGDDIWVPIEECQ